MKYRFAGLGMEDPRHCCWGSSSIDPDRWFFSLSHVLARRGLDTALP